MGSALSATSNAADAAAIVRLLDSSPAGQPIFRPHGKRPTPVSTAHPAPPQPLSEETRTRRPSPHRKPSTFAAQAHAYDSLRRRSTSASSQSSVGVDGVVPVSDSVQNAEADSSGSEDTTREFTHVRFAFEVPAEDESIYKGPPPSPEPEAEAGRAAATQADDDIPDIVLSDVDGAAEAEEQQAERRQAKSNHDDKQQKAAQKIQALYRGRRERIHLVDASLKPINSDPIPPTSISVNALSPHPQPPPFTAPDVLPKDTPGYVPQDRRTSTPTNLPYMPAQWPSKGLHGSAGGSRLPSDAASADYGHGRASGDQFDGANGDEWDQTPFPREVNGILEDFPDFVHYKPTLSYSGRLALTLTSLRRILSENIPTSAVLACLPDHALIAFPRQWPPTNSVGDSFRCYLSSVLHDAIGVVDCRDQLISLRENDAQIMVCILQDVLDRIASIPVGTGRLDSSATTRTRRQFLRLLLKLAEQSQQLPDSLFITGANITQNYEPVAMGGFADVFQGNLGGKAVALKKLRVVVTNQQRSSIIRKLYREALMWKQLKHRFTLPFLGVDTISFSQSGAACMISPWMKRGSIIVFLADGGVELAERQRLVAECAEGLAYLHSYGINHGDVRGNNIFIDEHCHVQLADFGLSVVDNVTGRGMATATNQDGSARWMAPELHEPEQFGLEHYERTPATDVYAFGCTVLEIYTLKAPFEEVGPQTAVLLRIIKGARPKRPSDSECGGVGISDALWAMVERCWQHLREERPTMNDICATMPLP